MSPTINPVIVDRRYNRRHLPRWRTSLLDDFVPWLRLLSAVVALPYRRNLVQRLRTWRHLSTIDGKPLVGSTQVRESAAGDCFSLPCLVLLNMKNIFVYHDIYRLARKEHLFKGYINIPITLHFLFYHYSKIKKNNVYDIIGLCYGNKYFVPWIA